MNRLLVVAGLLLAMTCPAQAQDEVTPASSENGNVAANFASTPAARLAFLPLTDAANYRVLFSDAKEVAGFAPFAISKTSSEFGEPTLPWASPEPAPSPTPKASGGGPEDLHFQLALGISLIRFRSSFYYATAIGTSTSVTYFTGQSLGWEGSVITAFAPRIYANEHVKYFSYGVGPKLAWRRHQLQPWVHGIVGGAHIIPQTAGNGHNGFEFEAGGGADYLINPRVSIRLELDWVRTRLFGEWQNNAQAAIDGVFHF